MRRRCRWMPCPTTRGCRASKYEGGYTSYLEVLDAERSLFNAQLQLAQSQADVLLQATALYKSMGGGWVDLADQKATKPEKAG